MELSIIKQFVEEMANNSSTNAKKDILRKYSTDPFLVKILQYTYHPLKQYFVTSKSLEKRRSSVPNPTVVYTHIFPLLDALSTRKITGHEAIDAVNAYISLDPSTRDIVYQIVEKNLKTRATETIINEIIPGCIPVFEVQLAAKYNEYLEKVEKAAAKAKPGQKPKHVLDFVEDTWIGSYKLDGFRCVAIIDEEGKCTFMSRGGKEFTTLEKVKVEIEALGFKSAVFDGEICLRTEDGRDDFQGVLKEVSKKDHTVERPMYYIFDFMPLAIFLDPTHRDNTVVFSNRLEMLKYAISSRAKTTPQYFSILPQTVMTSLEHVEVLKQQAIAAGREGLMLKKDTVYQQGRTNDILKVKVFHDAEYEVVAISSEINRVIREGREVEIEMMKNVTILHQGSPVEVGSGWTQEEKIKYHANPSEIIGKIITVQYQDATIDQNGKPSLRFPVVKMVHGDVRTL